MRSPNRLALEKSPYLLQHAHNPVDWFPWGGEAFARARAGNRPIFLSIGYATCHWCHVMERESFENEAVAALLNEHFVPIKVDREERPDVDRLYMTALQAMRLGGGWPLNAFLTPDRVPFYGGTYFPPTSRQGRAGLTELLPRLLEAWQEQRGAIVEQGARVIAAVESLSRVEGDAPSHESLMRECDEALERSFDAESGGFGDAPKFPSPGNLSFLMRWWARDPQRRAGALARVRGQLDAMQAGGVHDHLGGGFHRYSTDRHWLVPHFEKMLYDQALLARAYLEAHVATGEPAYARTARGVLEYVLRDLAAPEGGFCSAEDADSEGEEGIFYVWTPAQLQAVLGAQEAKLFALRYGVSAGGNFERGASVLHEAAPPGALTAGAGVSQPNAAARLADARARLLVARGQRQRPLRDDKVIVAWNGLMIDALALGARVLGEPRYAEAAARAAEFAWTHLRDAATGGLRRRWRDGEAAGAGQLADYAAFSRGLLGLWDATFDPLWLERAVLVTGAQIERFWDDDDGAFFENPADEGGVLVRMKEGYDGAELAGNSLAAQVLVRLGALFGREDWRAKAARLLDYHARRLKDNAWAMPEMLAAMDLAAGTGRLVVVVGEPGRERDALMAPLRASFRPTDELVVVDEHSRPALQRLAPFLATLPAPPGRALAYVCIDHACRLPVDDPRELLAQLEEPAPAGVPGEPR